MNLFELDIDDSFNFFCPITGSQILGPDFFHPSNATVFTFSLEAGDFDLIDEPYKAIWNGIDAVWGRSIGFRAVETILRSAERGVSQRARVRLHCPRFRVRPGVEYDLRRHRVYSW